MSALAPRRVRAVVEENLASAEDEEAGDRALQLVVDPEAAHGVVHGGVDAHRDLVGILVGDALNMSKRFAVALRDRVDAEAADGVAEVKVDAEAGFGRRRALVAYGFKSWARGDVAGDEVAEAGYLRSR